MGIKFRWPTVQYCLRTRGDVVSVAKITRGFGIEPTDSFTQKRSSKTDDGYWNPRYGWFYVSRWYTLRKSKGIGATGFARRLLPNADRIRDFCAAHALVPEIYISVWQEYKYAQSDSAHIPLALSTLAVKIGAIIEVEVYYALTDEDTKEEYRLRTGKVWSDRK